ncbi:MAG: CBS domain-containing protein [Candidatus Bathyarchaeia archaeon]|jgi:CBS domain-containing protein
MTVPRPEETVRAIMTKNPITVDFDAPVRNALQTMIDRDIGSLIVLKHGNPVGIITERDVTRISLRLITGQNIYEDIVGRLMSSPIITVPPDAPIRQAVELMVTRKIRRLPIVDQGRLVGIVTERDLFKWSSSILRNRK